MSIPSFINLSSLFSSHWNVVLLVAATFFLLQMGLCLRFAMRMRRDERTLAALLDDLRRGGKGRGMSRRFPWLIWVSEIFPADSTTSGNYARDDVLNELDTHIASRADYLLLQRLGVMAPLLGVILTVLGFWWLDFSDAENQSLDELIFAVTPLVIGVGSGAVLALINQALLHFAGMRSEALRMAARRWFDRAVWHEVGLDTQAATVKAIAGIEKMARALSDTADKHQETTQWLSESTLAIQESATEFHDVVQGLSARVRGLPESLAELRNAMHSSVETFESLIPVAERVVAGLDVSVSAFRTAVENQFLEAAKLHRTAIVDISDAADRLSESTGHLRVGSKEID
ncbi:MAG: hypothetical protein ACC628_08035 [Pirellulaceae bacterium]